MKVRSEEEQKGQFVHVKTRDGQFTKQLGLTVNETTDVVTQKPRIWRVTLARSEMATNQQQQQPHTQIYLLSMNRAISVAIISSKRSLITRHYSNTTTNMIFSRNIILAAAAAVYGASSTSAFAPSTGECTHLCSSSIAVRKDYVELQLTSLFVAINMVNYGRK